MNKKCSSCGFINFASAEECKKCEAVLPAAGEVQNPNTNRLPYANTAPGRYTPSVPKGGFPVKTVVGAGVGIVVLVMCAGLMLAVSLSRSRKVQWVEYHPDGMDMTVMMPNEPQAHEPVTTPLAIGSMTNHTYVSSVMGQGQAVFCVVEYSGGESLIKPQLASQMMDGELTALMKRLNAIQISKNFVPYKGIVALEFVIQPMAGRESGLVHGKMFVIRDRLYCFMITAKEGSELFAGKDKFLDPIVRTT